MTDLFTAILNMSITASYVALAVIAIRILLKKFPKVFSYALWLAVLIRLVCPFSFKASFSLLSYLNPNIQASTGAMTYVPYNIGLSQNPAVELGMNAINQAVNSSLPTATPTASINPMQILLGIAGIIWVVGIAALLIYSIFSYLKIIKHVKTATLVKDNIFETDSIITPFLCGFIKPKIYVPVGMSPNELAYVIAHEQTHIKRLDYLIKPFTFLVLVVHWFNPLMWVSFALMSKDMEMSCDESVIKKMGNAAKGDYSNALLSLSVKRSGLLSSSPLAFGESNIKSRIKNILNYKKPAFWVVVAASVVTVVFAVGLIANPAEQQDLLFTKHLASLAAQAETGKVIADSSVYGECQLDANQVSYLLDQAKWKTQKVRSPNALTASITLKIPAGANSDVRFYYAEPSLAMVIYEGEHHYYKIPESDFETINKLVLATVWANALKTREGKPRYEMMSAGMKENFIQEQINRSGKNWNYNIGVSSPWVVDFEVKMSGMTANILYLTKTSEPAYYNTKEILTFGKVNGKFVVLDHQFVYEDKLVDNKKANTQADSPDTAMKIEENLAIITSSPKTSSNPHDYIKAHQNEYENILRMGDDALRYLLAQFEKSNGNNDLRAHIMMALCKDLLGDRNNVTDESLSPQDWFSLIK